MTDYTDEFNRNPNEVIKGQAGHEEILLLGRLLLAPFKKFFKFFIRTLDK